MKIKIIGLDIGKNTGWAVVLAGDYEINLLDYGIIRSKDHVDWYKKVVAILKDELSHTDEDRLYVAYEEVLFNKGMAASRAYGGYIAALKIACDTAGVKNQLIPLSVSEIKKYIGGSHVANKDDVAKGLDLFDFNIKSRLPSDITDAIAIAVTACAPMFMFKPKMKKGSEHEESADEKEV